MEEQKNVKTIGGGYIYSTYDVEKNSEKQAGSYNIFLFGIWKHEKWST